MELFRNNPNSCYLILDSSKFSYNPNFFNSSSSTINVSSNRSCLNPGNTSAVLVKLLSNKRAANSVRKNSIYQSKINVEVINLCIATISINVNSSHGVPVKINSIGNTLSYLFFKIIFYSN